jgi:hypothetical protein
MTNSITCERTETLVTRQHEGFGLRDDQGREIGFGFTVYQFDFVKDDNAEMTKRCWVRPEDFRPQTFTLFPWNARNGKGFGTGPRAKEFDTLDEAMAYGNTLKAKAQKKVIKKIKALIENA